MIGNELVRELVETVILTGKLKDNPPLSLILIATPESGKTSVVLERPCKSIKAFTDITGRGIQEVIQDKPELTHIVINDMVSVMSHRQSVNKYTIAVLNALTEEGVTAVASPDGIEEFKNGRKGVITSLTTDLTGDSRNWWNKVGFTTRMLPFCYSYPDELKIKIKDSIDKSEEVTFKKLPKPQEFTVPQNLRVVNYPTFLIEAVRRVASIRSQIMNEVGFRRLKQYHSLVKGHALLRNDNEVKEQDLHFLYEVDEYVSYDNPLPLKFPTKAVSNGK